MGDCGDYAGFSGAVFAGKPVAVTYSDINITLGSQTFSFSGAEKSFSQSATGGRIVFDLTQLGTPGYAPLPQVDTGALEPKGNHWEIQSNLGTKSYIYIGTVHPRRTRPWRLASPFATSI